jgi:hypothetical protein
VHNILPIIGSKIDRAREDSACPASRAAAGKIRHVANPSKGGPQFVVRIEQIRGDRETSLRRGFLVMTPDFVAAQSG